MQRWFFIGCLTALLLIIGQVANGLEISQNTVKVPCTYETQTNCTPKPEQPSGKLLEILTIAKWVWTSLVGMFQLMTFQIRGIPPVVNALVLVPVGLMVVVLVVMIVRGD